MDMITDAQQVAKHEAAREAAQAGHQHRRNVQQLGMRVRVHPRRMAQPPQMGGQHDFIKGVVNLRGVIVPVVDLRLKLGCDSADTTDFTVVIVLNVKGRVVGAVVDSVSDVLELSRDSIKPAPEMSSAVDAGFITGIGAVKNGDAERMLILMDIESLMASAEMGLITELH